MTKLHELFSTQGQSPWIDNLTRPMVSSGRLGELVQQGVRGVTSNPTIFQKAIAGSDEYDEQFSSLLHDGNSIEDVYWVLVVEDIREALQVLRPVYDGSGGGGRGVGAGGRGVGAGAGGPPRLSAAAGVATARQFDGQDLLGADRRQRLLLEFWRLTGHHIPMWRALLTPSFEYIEYRREDGSLLEREAYRLDIDPHQLTNLYGDRNRQNDPWPRSKLLARLASCEGATCP
jgi:hypothetical protein